MTLADSQKRFFTAGEVAKIAQVSPRTVRKWVDSGRLRGDRLPGSGGRRIPREHLVRFFKEHGMPLGELAADGVEGDGLQQPAGEAQGTLPTEGLLPTPESVEEAWVRREEHRRETVERLKGRATFTTGQVALLVNVAPRTVLHWFDSGRLGGERRGRRRVIPREELLRFLTYHNMPIPWLLGQAE
jgi:excisionase family DNA binding protein